MVCADEDFERHGVDAFRSIEDRGAISPDQELVTA